MLVELKSIDPFLQEIVNAFKQAEQAELAAMKEARANIKAKEKKVRQLERVEG